MVAQTSQWNETNRTLLAAIVVSLFVMVAIIAVSRVPRQSAPPASTATGNVATATALPPEPTYIANRLGILTFKEGTTLTVTAQTIDGNRLTPVAYTVQTGSSTVLETVDFRTPLATSLTAKRAATTLEAIPVGAQVNAIAAENIRDKREFAATKIEYQLLTP